MFVDAPGYFVSWKNETGAKHSGLDNSGWSLDHLMIYAIAFDELCDEGGPCHGTVRVAPSCTFTNRASRGKQTHTRMLLRSWLASRKTSRQF